MVRFASVVVFTGHLGRCVNFYRALGVPLADEDHGDGAVHAAADVGDVHFAVFESVGAGTAPGHQVTGGTFVGFWVDSLEDTTAALQASGADLVVGHETMAWGCRLVFADPDGRAVEINQAGHCPPPAPDLDARLD